MRRVSLLFSVSLGLWGASFTGSVYDASTHQPIAGALITAGTTTVRTDANGSFRIEAVDKSYGVRALGYERKRYISSGKVYLKPLKPKALYLSSFGASDKGIMDRALRLIDTTELSALVIDIKMDRGQIAYQTNHPLAKEIGAQKTVLIKDLPGFVAKLRSRGIYTIARIVSFKDSPLAHAKPEWAVKRNGALFVDRENLSWVDPSRKEVWDYIIDIAEEAAQAGFDEIQFDYVRFPDAKGIEFSRPNTQQMRVDAITGFLAEAKRRLTPYNVFISADIFGYTAWNSNDTNIGQKVEKIAPLVDYLSPMLYPSGFTFGIPGHRNPVQDPYAIVRKTLEASLKKSNNSPMAYRPWLQAFRDYAFDRRIFGGWEIREQIRAAEEFGSCGWILWNPRNVYTADGLAREDIREATTKKSALTPAPKVGG